MLAQTEARLRIPARGIGDRATALRVRAEAQDLLGERRGIVGRREIPGRAVANRLDVAAGGGGYHEGTEQHRLDQGAAERLVDRRDQVDVAGRDPGLRRV